MKFQAGGFALGLIAGLLLGLALALGVAIYITKTPVPFIDKVPQRTAEQDSAEAERNKDWNPNAPLAASVPPRVAAPAPAPAAASAADAAMLPPPAPPARDPAAILAGQMPATARPPPAAAASAAKAAADPFTYLVQAGAYTRAEDAEQQRAKLALLGLQASITEREQAGRTVYRVRLGPFEARADADNTQQQLQASGVEAQLVRVQKP